MKDKKNNMNNAIKKRLNIKVLFFSALIMVAALLGKVYNYYGFYDFYDFMSGDYIPIVFSLLLLLLLGFYILVIGKNTSNSDSQKLETEKAINTSNSDSQKSETEKAINTSNSDSQKSETEKAIESILHAYDIGNLSESYIDIIYRQKIAQKKRSVNISKLDFLEKLLNYVTEFDTDGTLTKNINEIVKPLLDKEKLEKPYPNVNERERNILIAIENSARAKEKQEVKNRLEELAGFLVKNQRDLKRARVINDLTIPISIVSVIFAIHSSIFGTPIPKKQINDVSNHISKQVLESINNKTKQLQSDNKEIGNWYKQNDSIYMYIHDK